MINARLWEGETGNFLCKPNIFWYLQLPNQNFKLFWFPSSTHSDFWPNRLTTRHRLICQTNSKDSSLWHTSHKENHFKADISCISLANNRFMDIFGWLNIEKLASTCVQIWLQPKWVQVNTSVTTQGLAKWSRK